MLRILLAREAAAADEGTATTSFRERAVRGTAWGADVESRISELQTRLDEVVGAGDVEPADAPPLVAAQLALDDARRLLDSQDAASRWRRERFIQWWSGAANTIAWQAVHDAENALLQVEDEPRLRAQVVYLRTRLTQVAAPQDALRKALSSRLDQLAKEPHVFRPELQGIHTFVCRKSDSWHADLRKFRNLYLGLSGALAIGLLIAGAVQLTDANVLWVCNANTCFQGADPVAGDLLLVLLLGALGGLLAMLVPLAEVQAVPTRFNVRGVQAVLKAVSGALTGWIGVMLVLSGLIDVKVTTARLVVYALLFGYSQQLLTRFVDRRASDLLGEKPANP